MKKSRRVYVVRKKDDGVYWTDYANLLFSTKKDAAKATKLEYAEAEDLADRQWKDGYQSLCDEGLQSVLGFTPENDKVYAMTITVEG